jgi:hypothetical protein
MRRLACRLTIVLCLSFPTGMAVGQQDAAGSANSTGQAQASPTQKENALAEQVPAETTQKAPMNPQTPAAGEKAPDAATTKKTDVGSPSGTISGTVSGTRKRRKRTTPAPNSTPRKIVVREGGAREPAAQIEPDITPAEATRERQNAERLLGSADGQLKQLTGRPLNAQQQETVGQIRNYMQGARSALKEGDVRRAGTLAEKAQLLSDDLVRH